MPEVRVSGADAERVVRSELLVARVELAINTVGSTTDEIKTALDELRIERQFARQELEKRLGRGRLAIDLSAEEIAQVSLNEALRQARRLRNRRLKKWPGITVLANASLSESGMDGWDSAEPRNTSCKRSRDDATRSRACRRR